jgi:geranylgeranyl diphosphate synthase type I
MQSPLRRSSRTPARPPELEAAIESAIERALLRLTPAPQPVQAWVEAMRDLCVRGGKRIRPRLCALAYEGIAGKPVPAGVYTFAAGLELLHVFMLVHDDLIDGAQTRRGAPTLHHRPSLRHPSDSTGMLQQHLAMLSGDMLFALSIETMCAAEMPAGRAREAMARILETAREAAMGELLDVLYGRSALRELSSAELAEVLRLKTANYTFVGPLLAGASLAGGSPSALRALSSFGGRVGVAFQLADDLLDLFGEANQIGKPVGGDLREGKRTVLMRLALDRASPGDGARLVSLLDRGSVSEVDLIWVKQLLVELGVAQEVSGRVRQLVRAACQALPRAELRPEAALELRALANKIVATLPVLPRGGR